MTVLLCIVPSKFGYPKGLVDLGVVANYETRHTIQQLRDHLAVYIPDLRVVNSAETNWVEAIESDRILNYTYGFGLLSDSIGPSLTLEGLKADYIGAQPAGLYLSANKPHMSALMASAGFSTPVERLISRDMERAAAEGLSRCFTTNHLVLKPAYEESSLGLLLIENEPEVIRRTVLYMREAIGEPLVIQEYVAGIDVTVPIIGRDTFSCLPAVALLRDTVSDEPFVFGADLKATKDSVHYEPIGTWPFSIRRELYDMALTAFRLAGLRDYGRLDCRVTPQGQCYFLEINANPQLGLDKASFAVSASAINMEVGDIVRRMLSYDSLPYGRCPLSLGY